MTSKEQQDTRNAILGAAFQLLSTQPYDGLGMMRMAEEAGVSKALLFYHFKSKEELCREALVWGIEEEFKSFEALGALSEEQLPAVMAQWLEFASGKLQLIYNTMKIADFSNPEDSLLVLMREVYAIFMGLFQKIMEQNQVPFPEEKALLVTLALDSFGLASLVKEEKPDIEAYTRALLDILGVEFGNFKNTISHIEVKK